MTTPQQSGQPGTLAARVLRGTFWTFAMRWSVRFLGLLSTVVLARLLAPEDFGLVALLLSVQGFIDVFFYLGVEFALIRNKDADEKDFNTAWTLRLIQSIVAFTAVVLAAPAAARYFGDDRVEVLLPIVAVAILLRGAENIGVVDFQRHLDFYSDFRLHAISKILSVCITLTLAVYFKNYWALVIGTVSATAIKSALSYSMHPFRPRPSLARARGMLTFSIWLFLRNIGSYTSGQADRFALGGLTSPTIVGYFALAKEASSATIDEIALPIGRVLLPGFASIRDDVPRLRRAFLKGIGVILPITLPAAIGVYLTADQFVPLAFGAKWSEAIPLTQVLALAAGMRSFQYIANDFLLVLGRERLLACFELAQGCVVLGSIVVGFRHAGAPGAAIAIAAVVSLFTLMLGVITTRSAGLPGLALVRSVLRPILACAVMTLVLGFLDTGAAPSWLALGGEVALGAVTYIVTSGLLWLASGSPDGIEREIVSRIRRD